MGRACSSAFLCTALRFLRPAKALLQLSRPCQLRHRHSYQPYTTTTENKAAQTVKQQRGDDGAAEASPPTSDVKPAAEPGALSQRLAEYTEDALAANPRFAKAAVESGEFDFNAELKLKLQERLAAAEFKTQHAQALGAVSLPVGL